MPLLQLIHPSIHGTLTIVVFLLVWRSAEARDNRAQTRCATPSRIPPLFTVPRKLCSQNIKQTFPFPVAPPMPIPKHWSVRNDKHDSNIFSHPTQHISAAAVAAFFFSGKGIKWWMLTKSIILGIFFDYIPSICSHADCGYLRAGVIKRAAQFVANCRLQIIEIQFGVAR